jgi:hypothetical protein
MPIENPDFQLVRESREEIVTGGGDTGRRPGQRLEAAIGGSALRQEQVQRIRHGHLVRLGTLTMGMSLKQSVALRLEAVPAAATGR